MGLFVEICLAVVIVGVMVSIFRSDEITDFGSIVITVIMIAVANVAVTLALLPFAGLGTLAVVFLLDALIIRWRCALSWPKAFITVAVLVGVRLALALIFKV